MIKVVTNAGNYENTEIFNIFIQAKVIIKVSIITTTGSVKRESFVKFH